VRPTQQPFTIEEAPLLLRHHPSIWSAIYSKKFLDEKSIKFWEFPGAGWADNPFLVETLCQAKAIIYLDKPYYCYREDTPEKSKSFYTSNPLMPIERWHDTKDILDRLHIKDRGILLAQNSRGFSYLNDVLEAVGLDAPGLKNEVVRMFDRMDLELVYADPQIPPESKRLFARLKGLSEPKVSNFAYYKSLISQGLYSVGNIGLKNTLTTTFRYFEKRGKR
jgi:hypothetical protein